MKTIFLFVYLLVYLKNTVFLHTKYLKSKQIYGGQCKTVLLKEWTIQNIV